MLKTLLTLLLSLALTAAVALAGTININKANQKELESLPGLGASKAQAIVDYRKQNGPFKSVDDLVKVKGIGAKTLDKFRPNITVKDS